MLPGANPETMASSVATPLEREFSTIAGIDIDELDKRAGLDRNHGSVRARPQHRCRGAGCAGRHLEGRRPAAAEHAAAAFVSRRRTRRSSRCSTWRWTRTTLPLYTVNEYADTLLAQRISMVSGVSRVQVYGAQKYAVRVQVDPDELAAHDIGIDEVQRAIQQQQHESADRADWTARSRPSPSNPPDS